MAKFFPFLLIVLLTGCNALGWSNATPTPSIDDIALARFLTQAPIPMRITATPRMDETNQSGIPHGLPLPLVDPLELYGDLVISGSPALAPLTRLLYDQFIIAGYSSMMRIEEVGSDVIFERYCNPESATRLAIDIVMADRPITQSQLELCQQQDRQPVALQVASDAVAVVLNGDTTFTKQVSKAELTAIFTARRWSDVRRDWPDQEIIHIVPTTDSTIATLFINKILQRNSSLLQNAPTTTFLADGKEIATTVADTPWAVGFLSYADYYENAAGLHLLAIDGIQPTQQSVSRGEYALTYPLLLYADLATLQNKPQLSAFLMYYLATVNEVSNKVGNFTLSEALYERTKIVLLNAMGQESYLEQFAPTSTPTPPATMTPIVTSTITSTVTVTATTTSVK